MTVRCALYVGALKIFERPSYIKRTLLLQHRIKVYPYESYDVFTAMHTSNSFIGENMPEDCDDFEDIKSKLMMLYL